MKDLRHAEPGDRSSPTLARVASRARQEARDACQECVKGQTEERGLHARELRVSRALVRAARTQESLESFHVEIDDRRDVER